MVNKRLINTGVEAAPAVFDPLQNFETVTYTGNGGTQKITGYIRKGAAFNGSSSDIAIPATATTPFDPSQENHTVSFWFNLSSNAADQVIIGKWYSSIRSWQVATTSSNRIVIYERGGATTQSHITTATFSTNTWHHFVYIRNGSQVITYIDNQSTPDTFSVTYALEDGGTANIQIGRQQDSTGWITGKVDQVRLFNTVLNSTQVGQLALETYASSTKSTTDIFGDGSGVALYQLDENANDTGRDFGQSAVFNGSSSEIDIPHNTEFDATGGLSISLWINKAVLDSSNDRIMDKANGGSGSYGWEMMYNSTNGYRLDVYDTSNSVSSARSGSSGISATGIWDHVVGTISSSGVVKLYVNGVLKDTTSALSGTISTNTGSVTIGRYYNAAGGCNAKFDQIRFFNAEIDQAAVDTLYAEYNISTTNLIAHYKLDGDATDEQGSYDGTASNVTYSDGVKFDGTATNVNFLGMAFQPDLVVIKNRETAGYEFTWFDSIRGALQRLRSDSTSGTLAEDTKLGSLTSFDANGFSLGNYAGTNQSAKGHVAWCWKAAGAAVSGSGTNGIANVLISANTAAGFSIVEYDGAGVNATVEHGLDSAPELIFVKRTDTSGNWITYVESLGVNKYLYLNSTAGEASFAATWGTAVDSTSFGLTGAFSDHNNASGTYNDYCFHSVDGYQKIGSYTGNGNASFGTSAVAQSITTGFRPRFVLIKITSASDHWIVFDSVRKNTSTTYSQYQTLNPNLTTAEGNASAGGGYWHMVDFTDTGFDLGQDPSLLVNKSGATYIYWAIA